MTGIVADPTEIETEIVTVATAIVIATCGATDRAIHGAIGPAAISRNADPALSAARRLARTNRSGRIRDPVRTNLREQTSPHGGTSRREETNRPQPEAMKGSARRTSVAAMSAATEEAEVGAGAAADGGTAANMLRTGATTNPPLPRSATARAARRHRRACRLHLRPHRPNRHLRRHPRRRVFNRRRRTVRLPLLDPSRQHRRARERKTSTWSGLPRRSRFRAEAPTSANRSAAA
jgi:hypothetical protein